MEDKNKDKKPNMPKFNMTWVYVTILIALALLYFTNNGEGQTGGNGGIAQKDNYSNFKEWVMKGAAEEVVVNNEEKELRMYVKPEFIQEIFKADVKQTGKSPYLEVEFGSEEKLEEFLTEHGQSLDTVIQLVVDEDLLIKRLTGRRVCKTCGASFHVVNIPPKKEGICDFCGAPLVQRADDNEETAANRIEVYNKETKPLIDYYEKAGNISHIDGTTGLENVFNTITEILGD